MNESNQVFKVPNWIAGRETLPSSDLWFEKFNPHNSSLLSYIAESDGRDVELAIKAASDSYSEWSELTPVQRGKLLGRLAGLMSDNAQELANCNALETGKPPEDALGETHGAIQQAEFFAGEGMRLYGRSLTSGTQGKYTHSVRQPRGIAGLIVPANTPIANIAWKTFPALICGNTIVLKAAEDSPQIALLFARLTKKAGIPDGVFNVIQGRGKTAGAAIVKDPRVNMISFTGSTSVGKWIAEEGGKRLARVSLELGGKNPLVVCDDADLDLAVKWASLSAFSNAGQRCAAASRIIVMRSVYQDFRDKLVDKANGLKLGVEAGCDLGPVINARQYEMILSSIQEAQKKGAKLLCGGGAPADKSLSEGYYIQPTLLEDFSVSSDLSQKEIFGPVATMYIVDDMHEALMLANNTEYGLTAAIHTRNVDRAMWFAQRVKSGVANVNIGTYGSEPHMPFGGFGASGNGSREPGLEALDVYSELKCISFVVNESHL